MTENHDPRVELLKTLTDRVAEHAAAVDAQDVLWLDVAAQIVSGWRTRWQDPDSARPEVAEHLQRKFRLCFPLAANALNHVEAALTVKATSPWVAAASARVAFEHALTAQWVLLTESGEDKLVQEITAKGYTRANEFADALNGLARDDPKFTEHELSAEQRRVLIGEKPAPSGWAVQMLCDRFSNTRLFYDVYRDLSQAVHPSQGLLTAYLRVDPDHNVVGVDARGDAAGPEELPRALALAAVWALYVLEVTRKDQRFATGVVETGESAGLPVDLRASDQHPKRQPAVATYWASQS